MVRWLLCEPPMFQGILCGTRDTRSGRLATYYLRWLRFRGQGNCQDKGGPERYQGRATITKQTGPTAGGGRRKFTAEFKQEAVQMMLDGHSAASIAKNLGMKNANWLYRWKAEAMSRGDPAARTWRHRAITTTCSAKH